ncbi:murein transglycosylase A [Pseudomonas sp. R2.Fl]|nr:murein transglycosylase A [Pseudomonas sp. R2.Fl]
MTSGDPRFSLEACTFPEIDGWKEDDPRPLFAALARCLDRIDRIKPYRTGSIGLTSADLASALAGMPEAGEISAESARAFLEDRFVPFRIVPEAGKRGLVTAFYEPVVEVAGEEDAIFRYPFYRQPPDLVEVTESLAPPGWDPEFRFGRRTSKGLEIYHDRQAIDRGFLAGQQLEIAWAKSKIDVFFAHVQGAARLAFPDGRQLRITYAAKSGHPFSGIGRYLIDTGEIPAADISMQAIRRWLGEHPERVDQILWRNRSYIFFRESPVENPDLGPIAAAKVQLVPGRSLAVDRTIHTFGFPFFVRAESITHMDQGRPFARLMLALDTGSAILGPARGDIFTGSGDAAGEMAGAVKNDADFFILIPKHVAPRFAR